MFRDSLGKETRVGAKVVYNSSGYLSLGYVHAIKDNHIEIERIITNPRVYFTSPYAKVRDGHSIINVDAL